VLYSVKQASELLNVATGTIYALCAAGKLRCSRVGLGRGVLRISDEAIQEYLKSREAGIQPVVVKPIARKLNLRHFSLP
jgi:excisionase family DNA binding protein